MKDSRDSSSKANMRVGEGCMDGPPVLVLLIDLVFDVDDGGMGCEMRMGVIPAHTPANRGMALEQFGCAVMCAQHMRSQLQGKTITAALPQLTQSFAYIRCRSTAPSHSVQELTACSSAPGSAQPGTGPLDPSPH